MPRNFREIVHIQRRGVSLLSSNKLRDVKRGGRVLELDLGLPGCASEAKLDVNAEYVSGFGDVYEAAGLTGETAREVGDEAGRTGRRKD